MEPNKKVWNYIYKFEQPYNMPEPFGKHEPEVGSTDWINNLDDVHHEMILLDLLCIDLEDSDCDEARQMLDKIGIKS